MEDIGIGAYETVLGEKLDKEDAENESSEENITCNLEDRQRSEAVQGNASDATAEIGIFEVTSVCGSTANISDVSLISEENIVESIARDSLEMLSETASEENSKNDSGCAGDKRELCDAVELPSTVTDREEIFMPQGIDINDPRIYGKWLLFTYGDLNLQDRLWIELQVLVHRGDIILLKSSTARNSPDHDQSQGVIMCYTSEDIGAIKRAGVAIQDIVKDDTVLNYKTNEDSNKNVYRRFGSRFIARYMLLANGKLYERDYLDRWKKVADSSTENPRVAKCSQDYSPSKKREKPECPDLLFPSRERKRPRYVYPTDTTLRNCSGIWSFFCDAFEVDTDGTTELDRIWKQTIDLCVEGYLSSTSCQTRAFKLGEGENPLRRALTCELKNYTDVDRVTQTADKLRERTGFRHCMYFKVCFRERKKKLQYYMKYMYTEDGDLYEHGANGWKLLKRGSDNICQFKV